MELYFIRHGSTEFNEQRRLRGWLNPEMSELGLQQCKLLADYFSKEDVSKIYSSDLIRSSECANMISEAVGLPFEETQSLRPINFGDLQGRPLDEILPQLDRLMEQWQFDPNIKAPNGESFKSFQDRTYQFITKVVEEADDEDCVLLVTHVRVCLYTAQLVINKFKELQGKDLDRLNTLEVLPGNYIQVSKMEDGFFRLSGVNQLNQEDVESEQPPVTSEAGT